jgi:hypothetical protein
LDRFQIPLSGGNGIIYAVNQQGQLLFYRDNTRMAPATSIHPPSSASAVGPTLISFSPAATASSMRPKQALTPSNAYVIDANLQLTTVVCEAETLAVNQDQKAVNSLQAQLRELEKEFAQAPASEKPAILTDIKELEKDELAPAQAKLAADTKALEACRARSGLPTSQKPAASVETPAVRRVTVSV